MANCSGLLASRLLRLLLTTIVVLAGCQFNLTQRKPTAPGPDTVLHPDYREVREEVAALVQDIRRKYGIKGLSVALVDDQELVWAEGFGYADVAKGVAATPRTVYRTGSIAKPFTALAVMQLDEERWIDIDQPLFAYLPQFSIRSRFNTTAQPITVRSVLTHHSGLPSDLHKGMWSEDDFTTVATALADEYAAYPPDLVFSYSNVGYTLLGHMVQEETGESFPDYVHQTITGPLEMRHTAFRLNSTIQPLLSKGYKGDREARLIPIRDLPAYSLYSNVLDLSRFMSMLLAGGRDGDREIVMAGTLSEMFSVQNSDVSLDLHVRNGLGWFIERDTVLGGGYMVRHGGTTLYFASELILLPEHRLGAVVLANTADSRAVVSRLAEVILELALDAREGARPSATGLFLAEMPDQPVSADASDPTGRYVTDLGLIAVRPRDEKLCACVVEKTIDLIPYPDGWFGVRQHSVDSLPPALRLFGHLRFATRVIDGREVMIAERDGQEILLGEKMPPVAIPESWMRRVGRYQVLNPDQESPVTAPSISFKHGTLEISYRMPLISDKLVRMPIRPISDTEAVILGLGRTRGETLRAVMVDGEECLHYSGYMGRKVR